MVRCRSVHVHVHMACLQLLQLMDLRDRCDSRLNLFENFLDGSEFLAASLS